MATYKGYFKPKNPQKYKGDPTNIVYRSRWELKFMSYVDNHDDIISWSSEEVIVPYISPVDGKRHRYFPDFLITKINNEGKKETLMIEIKPFKQTKPPEIQTKKTKTYLNEVFTWGINSAKWAAAEEYCKDKGYKFVIMTENELGVKF